MQSDHTRRMFLKTAAAAGVGAAVTPWSAFARVPDARIRVGVVGCGGRGTGAAAQALAADAGVVIWSMSDAFADRIEQSLKQLLGSEQKDRVDVPPERRHVGIGSIDALLAEVDVVLLCSPPGFRPEQLAKSVAAGKHIFCEKPVCVDGPGYRSVLESVRSARTKGLSLVSGFCWRSSSPERAMFEQIHAGTLGEVVGVHSTYLTSPLGVRARQPDWSDLDFQLRNWQHFTWLSGDHLVEQAVHSVDKIHWAMSGRLPIRCVGMGSRFVHDPLPERGDVYDNFAVTYEYENGPRCVLMCRQQPDCYNINDDWINGTKGFGWVNGWGPTHWIKDYAGSLLWSYPKDGPAPNMYQVEHDTLFAAIRSARPVNEGEWMANSCMMAIMGRMSAYSGQAITWEQATQSNEALRPAELGGALAVPPVPRPGRRAVRPAPSV